MKRKLPLWVRVPVLMLIGAMATGVAVHAETPLTFHYDSSAGTTRAKVKNTYGTTIAAVFYLDAVPISYDQQDNDFDVPTQVLAQLRDELGTSGDPDAPDAELFVKGLLGVDANTPASQISWGAVTPVSYVETNTSEHCGTRVNSVFECNSTVPVSSGALCIGYACKRVRVLEP